MSQAQNLRFLFDRPNQPIFREKGLNGDITFDVPPKYFDERYRNISTEVQIRLPMASDGKFIAVKEYAVPDLTIPMLLPKHANFCLFNDYHKKLAKHLITTLLNIKTADELQSACVYAQQRINPYMFVYAVSVVMLHHPETKNVQIPAHCSTFPDMYFSKSVINDARRVAKTIESPNSRPVVKVPRSTGSTSDPENRLGYFREDIGINMHHWHWHLIYPGTGPPQVLKKDRRGEMFYYMHQQIIARYNIERFCNNLPRAVPFSNFHDPVPEAYFPKLDTTVGARTWSARQANSKFVALAREEDNLYVTIQDMERWMDRIYEAIHRGYVDAGKGKTVELTEKEGIDILGNLIESSDLSINRAFYGNFHAEGHNMLALTHDPDGRFLETFSPIGEVSISMRDPAFYRLHTTVNDMFIAYKRTLPPYTVEQLSFSGVKVTGIEILTASTKAKNKSIRNVLQTHWERNVVDLSRGIDFVPRGRLNVEFSHLQHDPFTYRITVENSGAQRVGTVRIFLAPKHDERGKNFRMKDQSNFFIELDRFTATLKPGKNEIQRLSIESTITVPFETTFRNLDDVPKNNAEASEAFVYCGCGWPDYALLPKGTPEGYLCDLFVMVSDYQQDKVENTSINNNTAGCDNAFVFCGVRNSKYPDQNAMGFPFDRAPRDGVTSLSNFLTPNMATQKVTIRFEDRETKGITLNFSD